MTTIYAVLYSLFGLHSLYYHLCQLLLCIGSAIFLYLFFRYSFNALLALVLALIFLVHPLDSQVAFAIPAMQDALFFFFGILGLWLLARHKSYAMLLLVAVSFLLALFAKETALCFIAIALLYLLWWDRKRFLPFVGSMALPLILYVTLRIHALGFHVASSHNGPIDNLSFIGRLMTAPSIMQFYLTKFIFPWKLATGYYWVYPTFTVRHVLLPLLIDAAIVALVIYMALLIRRKSTKAQYYTYLFFAIWTGLGLFTTLQIIPLDLTACEIWFYFSVAGLLGMIGVILVTFQKYVRPDWFLVIAVLIIAGFGIRTAMRGTDYSSEYMLAAHDIASSRDDYAAYNVLAGDLNDKHQYTEATVDTTRSIDIYPLYSNYNNLGVALTGLGHYYGAIAAYKQGMAEGEYVYTYENLAALYIAYGSLPARIAFYQTAVAKFPQNSSIWMYLAIFEEEYNDSSQAKISIAKAARYGQVPESLYSAIIDNKRLTIHIPNLDKTIDI